jgi:acetoin utilization protein AcuC
MLLVFGPRSTTYDFGPGHPLTPRRFGPAIELLRSVGAEPGLAPEPAPDEELLWCHSKRYIEAVRRFSADPYRLPEAGIGEGGDDPPFPGMHEAGAMVAGGSIRAMEAILRGDVEHAFHPGGGLHHAMRDRASGFCLYDDPALAIARARHDGLRVLYVDLDVHHGDGVQALHWNDPGVLTVSFHESGRYLFPGTGATAELGEGAAAGTSVNVPFEPGTGEGAWLAAVESIVPELAAAFGPDLVVSQHGADSHAWDPLAHLNVTTTAMGGAARTVDRVAHRWAGGRWLATGGGGYDAYRVVPRAWALTWLAGAHREAPIETPEAWRARWAVEGARYGQAPLPATFLDVPNAGLAIDGSQRAAEERSTATAALARAVVVPALLRAAADRGWWGADGEGTGSLGRGTVDPDADGGGGEPTIVDRVDAGEWEALRLGPRIVVPYDPVEAHGLIARALADPGVVVPAAVVGDLVVGLAVSAVGRAGRMGAVSDEGGGTIRHLLALGVAPARRRRGLGRALLARHLEAIGPASAGIEAVVTVAERDPFEPLDGSVRAAIARRLLGGAGFRVERADGPIAAVDPGALRAVRT